MTLLCAVFTDNSVLLAGDACSTVYELQGFPHPFPAALPTEKFPACSGSRPDRPISDVGDTFIMKMHWLGNDYLLLSLCGGALMLSLCGGARARSAHFWELAPGDPSRSRAEGNDPSKVGIPAGYR
jgi:hypothetical protein